MITRFKADSNYTLTNPSSAQNLIARSSNAADTMNLSIVGAIAGPTATVETRALTGQREVLFSTYSLVALTGANLASAAAGTVTIYQQGTAGTAQLLVTTVPASADTVTMGLTGFTTAYTFRSPCRATILCPAGAALVTGAAPGSYVSVVLNGTTKYFWFSNGTSTDPAPGGTGYAVAFTGGDSDTTIAAALQASMVTNLTAFATSVASATVTITGIALGAITITQDAGADFTLTTVAAGTADAANQIRTGYTIGGVAVTETDVANYINLAIDADGTPGQDFGTGTTQNTYITSSSSGVSVNLSDRLAVSRQLAWVFSQSGSALSLPATLSGGATGSTLATIPAGTTTVYNDIDLWSPDLGTDTMPALATPTTNSIAVRGKLSVIHTRCANISSAITAHVETSDDGTNWASRAATYAITPLDNNQQWLNINEPVEFLRVVFDANANTTASAVQMALITTS